MAVLAVSICSHGGKALLSRQFKELSRDRVTELMANFPSLLSSSTGQNTTVEDDLVRYVYQPLEEYYVVVLTNKQSNILQDIDTLQLFVSVTSQMLRSIDEKEIYANAFELLSAFDEIVTLGYCERLSLAQVQGFLEMDSHEEKIQEIIERNKEMEATEERRRRAKEIQRKELARRNMESQQAAVFGSSNASISGNSLQSQESFGYNTAPSGPSYGHAQAEIPQKKAPVSRAVGGKGLQLGKKPARQDTSEQRQPLLTGREPRQQETPEPQHLQQSAPVARLRPEEPATRSESPSVDSGILIIISEKVTAELSREGAVAAAEIKGDLHLRIGSAELARSRLILDVGEQKSVQYKTHPNVDKTLFASSGTIGLKDPSRPFPSNGQSLGVLRWKVQGSSEDTSLVPFVVTAWVSLDSGIAHVTLEYEVTPAYLSANPGQDLFADVNITIPVSPETAEEAILKEDSTGNVLYDVSDYGLVFTVAKISLADPVGAFEFSVPVEDEDSLFPMQISFNSARTTGVSDADGCFGQVRVLDVISADADERSFPFTLHSNLATEGYSVN